MPLLELWPLVLAVLLPVPLVLPELEEFVLEVPDEFPVLAEVALDVPADVEEPELLVVAVPDFELRINGFAMFKSRCDTFFGFGLHRSCPVQPFLKAFQHLLVVLECIHRSSRSSHNTQIISITSLKDSYNPLLSFLGVEVISALMLQY